VELHRVALASFSVDVGFAPTLTPTPGVAPTPPPGQFLQVPGTIIASAWSISAGDLAADGGK